MKLKTILATGAILIACLGVVSLAMWRAAHPIPIEKRAFRGTWTCETYGEGGEVCFQRPK